MTPASIVQLNHRHFPRGEIEQSIHSRFAEQVARFPDRPAVFTERFRWSYAELSSRVDALASTLLRQTGCEKGRVALLFDHDAPMCAAVLSTLRAGKAYVPLDPAYPVGRIRSMLEDSRVDAILAERSQIRLATALSGGAVPLIVAEEAQGGLARFPEVEGRALAYILYTSGSTGRPKGVVQNHRNVLHFIRAYTNNLLLGPDDRLTLLSSYSFDAAVMGMYGALLNGACLFPRSVRDDGFRDLPGWIRNSRITVYHSTPTVYRHFLSACKEGERFESVRRVVLGGEPVVRRDVEAFRRFFGRGTILVNGLGPTESTVTLENFVDHDTELASNTVPVGRPVCDTAVVLLDDEGRESSTTGEITYVSEHLALGYWQRPDLDALAFGSYHGRRCYRSGDLGRWRPDGMLEFLGRKDLQVKVHGVRIELAEVEAAVERVPGVTQCIAVARPSGDGEARLVAYVRLAAGATLDVPYLRQAVRALLPDAMVPSVVVPMDVFPLTPSGKVDRLSLPDAAPFLATADSGVPADLRTGTERRLAEIWRRLLGRPSVGRDDDFFAVGGDSLAAVCLADEVANAFSRNVALGRIFQLKTLAALAAALDSGADLSRSDAAVVPLRAGAGGGTHLFCICGVQLYQHLAEAIGGPHSVSGVFLPVEEKVLAGAGLPKLPELAGLYGEVVRAAQPRGPYRLAGVSFGGMLAFELARQLREAGEQVDFLAVLDTALPQTIAAGERWRAHMRLALRHGPPYVLEKLKSRIGRALLPGRLRLTRAASGPADRDPPPADPVAVRDRVYTSALDAYRRAMPSYDGELHFFRASEGSSELEQAAVPPDYNWSRFARRCQTHVVPGGHLSILGPPGVALLGRVVRDALDGCARTPTAGPWPEREQRASP